MSRWKCEICGLEFENFEARGFGGKIYCPLCYFKKENEQLHSIIKEVREFANNYKYWYGNNQDKLLEILDKENSNES